MKMRKPYRVVDEVWPELRSKIGKKFNKSRMTMRFDELNATDVFAETEALYEGLRKLNEKRYLKIAKEAYSDAYDEAKKNGFDEGKKKIPTEAFLLALFAAYNDITKYVYDHEIDRKRARLAEAIIADVQRNSKQEMISDYRRAESLWRKQSQQYALTVEDAAVLKAFKDAGVKRVQWVTADDERVCGACNGRDGKTYAIDKVPPKPHYLCRCYLTFAE